MALTSEEEAQFRAIIPKLYEHFVAPHGIPQYTKTFGAARTNWTRAYLSAVADAWSDAVHLTTLFNALGVKRDGDTVTAYELLEKVRALAQDGGTFPTVAAIAKAVNDDAAERQKE